jgi:hypothetical protein
VDQAAAKTQSQLGEVDYDEIGEIKDKIEWGGLRKSKPAL